jgi:hypothetical protein
MSEIKNPEKSVAVQQYCDHWWLVAPASAVDETLIPKTWGWLRVDDNRLFCVKQAPELEAKPIERSFMAAMVRRANDVDAAEVKALVDKQVAAYREQDREQIRREIDARTRDAKAAIEWKEDLKKRIGEDGYDWMEAEEVARAIKMVRAAGLSKTYHGVRKLEQELKTACTRLSKAISLVTGEQTELQLEAAE